MKLKLLDLNRMIWEWNFWMFLIWRFTYMLSCNLLSCKLQWMSIVKCESLSEGLITSYLHRWYAETLRKISKIATWEITRALTYLMSLPLFLIAFIDIQISLYYLINQLNFSGLMVWYFSDFKKFFESNCILS